VKAKEREKEYGLTIITRSVISVLENKWEKRSWAYSLAQEKKESVIVTKGS